jgi:hypothetical protein
MFLSPYLSLMLIRLSPEFDASLRHEERYGELRARAEFAAALPRARVCIP